MVNLNVLILSAIDTVVFSLFIYLFIYLFIIKLVQSERKQT